VVAERDHVGARGEQPVGELAGDARAVGGVLAVDDADVCGELRPQRGQALLDGAPAGDAEDVGEEEESQLRTSDADGRSSSDTWLPESFVYRASAWRSTRDRSATTPSRERPLITFMPTARDGSERSCVNDTMSDGAACGWMSMRDP
jgi:hypothetical protein